MAWVRTVEYDESDGELRRQYDAAVKRAGRIYNIVRIQGLGPGMLKASIDLYVAVMRNRASLSRMQREMLAVVVSKANSCQY